MNFEIVTAKDLVSTMIVDKDNKRYFLHSAYYPLKEAEEWVQTLDFCEDSIIIVYGIGLGYHINSLVKKLSETNRLILIEPSKEIFEYALKNGYYDNFKDRFNTYFVIANTEYDIKRMLGMYIPYYDFENIVCFDFKQYPNVFREHYKMYCESLIEIINSMRINRNTALYFASQWQSNFMENIEFIFKSTPVNRLFDIFKNVPAIIVSAGPSLDKNIEYLKEAKGRAVIICVGTALKALKKKGIEPDFVVSIDGSEKNYKHFEGCSTDAPLLYDLTIYPRILKEHKESLIICQLASTMTDLIEAKLLIEVGQLNTGPSVANLSLDFAYKMGCNPIVFIGQDLAYLDNRTHATGTTYEKDRIELENSNDKYVLVEGNYKDVVLTDRVFLSFKTWFETYIASHNDRTYINATEGGARIKGTKIMTLNDVLIKYLTKQYEIDMTIKNAVKNKVHVDIEKLDSLINEFERTIRRLKVLKVDCKRGAKLSEKLYNYYNGEEANANEAKILKILDKIDSKLRESKEHFAFISSILTIVTTKVLKGFKPDKGETEKQRKLRVASMSFTLYQGIYEAIEQSKDGLKNALDKLERIRDRQKISGGCINEIKR